LKDQETSEEDLRRMLKQRGYRDKAIEAILTWYK
jgi:SOS response regulatory protein OraA/RecX